MWNVVLSLVLMVAFSVFWLYPKRRNPWVVVGAWIGAAVVCVVLFVLKHHGVIG